MAALTDCSTEHARTVFVQCARMTSDLPEPTPNYGLLNLIVLVLAGTLIVDVAFSLVPRHRQQPLTLKGDRHGE